MIKKAAAPDHAMGTAPVSRLLLRNTLPLMVSLLAHSLYNFVDSVFVSHVSEKALTALSMAAPVQALIGALGLGIAVGLNAAISKAMGEGNGQKVRDTASASLWLAVAAWLIVALGKGNYSMHLTFVRQVALPLIFVSVLTAAGNLTHV